MLAAIPFKLQNPTVVLVFWILYWSYPGAFLLAEYGAQEIPYPTAEVVNKTALAAGPIARAAAKATPELGVQKVDITWVV